VVPAAAEVAQRARQAMQVRGERPAREASGSPS
jgi:hypothetical protein